MHIVIAGASGFLGRPLSFALRDAGHQVTRLVRGEDPAPDASLWDPSAGTVDQGLISEADAVINLAGSSISQWPRTRIREEEILNSRIRATETLAKAIGSSPRPPALLSGSGFSWYGADRGSEVLDESASAGKKGFLAKVAQSWEQATGPAADAGARIVLLRTATVLDKSGGALSMMEPLFRKGLGARLGNGRQFFSCISLRDWVGAVSFLAENRQVAGPVNLSAPETPTNAEFTRALGKAVNRPTLLVAPRFLVRRVLGSLADELLGSLRVRPRKLVSAGFEFSDETIDEMLGAAFGRR